MGPFSNAQYRLKQPNAAWNTNVNNQSWQFGFYFNGTGANASNQYIWDKAYGAYVIKLQLISSVWRVVVYRAHASGGANYSYWVAGTTALTPGHTYYVQISAAMPTNPQSAAAGNLHIHIATDQADPVHQTVTYAKSGTSDTTWYNDSDATNGLMLGNSPATNYNFNAYFWIIRSDSTARNWDGANGEWATDKTLWDPKVATEITCYADDATPIPGQSVRFSGILQTIDGVKIAGAPVYLWHCLVGGCPSSGWEITADMDTTRANGYYEIYVDVPSSPGTYYYGTEYAGDATHYNASSLPVTVTAIRVDANANPALISGSLIEIPDIYVSAAVDPVHVTKITNECEVLTPDITISAATITLTKIGLEVGALGNADDLLLGYSVRYHVRGKSSGRDNKSWSRSYAHNQRDSSPHSDRDPVDCDSDVCYKQRDRNENANCRLRLHSHFNNGRP